jgi:Flp pilus assembly pilin Flp
MTARSVCWPSCRDRPPLRRDAMGRAGQGIVEYGLILALTTAMTVIMLGLFGGALADVLAAIGAAIDSATGPS